ncbi:MAG: hypothetical protein FJX56_05240, partial [Alphaproteobacteria bacterium]|nr:hypothetical protein [Alphaproteobacteria bacterium]
AVALGAVIAHLRARRTGSADAGEATGLLTHHLVQDGETWSFIAKFLGEARAHPATVWPSASALFNV